MQSRIGKSGADEFIEYGVDGVTLLRYIYRSNTIPTNSPRPFIHPLRTLSGELVSVYRPHDHDWHTGLSMTVTYLNEKNFWGGGTYVHGQGYVDLDNHGSQEHQRFTKTVINDDTFSLAEELLWKPNSGGVWMEEEREIAIDRIDRAAGYYAISWKMALHNVSGMPLEFSSPTTHGRPAAGYGGLFWRGVRSFTGGQIIAPEDRGDYMGESFPWLAFTGKHDDGVHKSSTLLFVDDPFNIRYPNKWFVRKDPYACISFAFMFDEVYTLEAGDTLNLNYFVVIFDGAQSRETLSEVATQLTDHINP